MLGPALLFLTLARPACVCPSPPPAVTAPESCPVTLPPDPSFVPSPPQPSKAPFCAAWYGTQDLWTVVRPGGELGRNNKMFFWSDQWDWRHDWRPELTVTARRLDGDAPEPRVSRATNAHGGDIGHSMLIGLEIPTSGCWEVTGEYKGAALTFVAWVP